MLEALFREFHTDSPLELLYAEDLHADQCLAHRVIAGIRERCGSQRLLKRSACSKIMVELIVTC